MPAETVHIEELCLRIPGVSEAEARRLGEEVARRVAQALPPYGRTEHLGALDLRLTIPTGMAPGGLAETIARAILEKLQ